MNRAGRLQSAEHWLPTYNGKSVIRGYRKHFGVDWLCTIKELEMLGVLLDRTHVEQSNKPWRVTCGRKQLAKLEKENREELWEDSDDSFAYVAGYTPGGVPYGITREEIGEKGTGWGDEEDWDLPF
jgi:hypothetical protein